MASTGASAKKLHITDLDEDAQRLVVRFASQDEGSPGTDREIVLAAMSQDLGALHNVEDNMLNDKDFLLAAVRQNGYALQYASCALRDDKDVVLEALRQDHKTLTRQNHEIFINASARLQNDKDVVVAAVKGSGEHLRWMVSAELWEDADVQLALQEHTRVLNALKRGGGK